MAYKVCTGCKESKLTSDFYRKTVGVSSKCKLCTTAEQRAKRRNNFVPSENDTLLLESLRRCSVCDEVKPIQEFYKKKKSYEGVCKCCKDEKRIAHHAANPDIQEKRTQSIRDRKSSDPLFREKLRAYGASHYQLNKDHHNKLVDDWKKRNPEKAAATCAKWSKANSDRVCWHSNMRRTRKLQATPSWANDEWDEFVVKEIYHLSKLREDYLGMPHQVDHIVPLKSDLVCGLHCAANLQVLVKTENLSKGNRFWTDMW